ncbi:hypothetical protein H9633_10930 [Microbacterium sp. Re1]|uniref:Uncharacterized protein n=1 Tax=Microbacterium commune TaxID=2762219 RepID=A0ABR8W709_9MICO|nr:hypothetical protein [Microbacterium commune]MBD8012810.1 hypothetical protein [Microbacterium commune]
MVSKVAKGSVGQDIWAGDLRALRGLVKTADELADYVRDKRQAVIETGKNERRREAHESWAFMGEEAADARWIEGERDLLEKFDRASAVVLEVEQRRWALVSSGDPESVMADIDDPSDVRRIKIELAERYSALLGGYRLTIELDERRVQAVFEGPEAHWIDLVGTRLSGQLKRQRPWYWWFRSNVALWVVGVPVWLVGLILTLWLTNNGVELLAALGVNLVFVMLFSAVPIRLIQRLVRPFELVEDGEKVKTARRLKVVGSVVAWVVASIVLPIALIWLNPSLPQTEPTSTSSESAQR